MTIVSPTQKRGNRFKHGQKLTRLYNIWCAMKARCYNPKRTQYADYGGRGVMVCEQWAKDFVAFQEWAETNGYSDSLTIDRFPNKDGHYEPANCRWVTHKEQNRNRRDNVLITAFGESKTAQAWAEDCRCCVKRTTLNYRIFRSHWTVELAITTPTRKAVLHEPVFNSVADSRNPAAI